MKIMTEEEILEVVQAYMDGKEIEYKNQYSTKWLSAGHPLWNFRDTNYRIKRQPRVIWVNEYPKAGLGAAQTWYTSPDDALAFAASSDARSVKFIEVLDD